jgi:hypothetical protein
MRWYDDNERHPLTAFIVFRNTIISVEPVTKRVHNTQGAPRLFRRYKITFADRSQKLWPSSRVENIHESHLGSEIVIWRHSKMYPDDYRVTKAYEWDHRQSQMCDMVVDDPARIRELQRAYYMFGGQMMGIFKTEFRLALAVKNTYGVAIPEEEWLRISTLGELQRKIENMVRPPTHSENWRVLRRLIVQQLGFPPDELTPETALRVSMCTSGSVAVQLQDNRKGPSGTTSL